MTPDEFVRICDWDKRCGEHLMMLIPVFQDRRDLIEYVKELQTTLAKHASDMPIGSLFQIIHRGTDGTVQVRRIYECPECGWRFEVKTAQ